MNKIKAFIKPIAGLLAVGLLIYFFPDIFLYFAIAIILSMLGRPLCELIKKFHIKKFYLGDSLSAVLTMVAMFLTFSLIFLIIIPLVNKEILILSKIDTNAIVEYFEKPLEKIYNLLIQYNIIRPEEDILKMIEDKLYSIVNWNNFSSILPYTIGRHISHIWGLIKLLRIISYPTPLISPAVMAIVGFIYSFVLVHFVRSLRCSSFRCATL